MSLPTSRRISAALLSGALLIGIPLMATGPAEAAPAKEFKNCTAMHAVYKGGVAKSGAKDKRKSGKAKYKPYVNTALYNANKKSDADKDGVACES